MVSPASTWPPCELMKTVISRLGLGGEREQLARDRGGQLLGDLAADDDRAGPQQPLGDGVVGWGRRKVVLL